MGDYKMSQVEAVEQDRSRAVDEAAYWISRSKHERAVAAAVEERDRQWREQIEGLADRIEDPGKWYGGRVPSLLSEPARLLRYLMLSPEGDGKRCSCGRNVEGGWHTKDCAYGRFAPAVTTNLETNTNPEGDENLD